MNNDLEEIKKLYKPYRYTIKKNITLLNTTSGDFIVKKKENDIKKIYKYLLSRNFDYFPKLIDGNRSEVNIYEYIDDIDMPLEQKASDMIKLVSLLHNKTTYYKVVSEDKFKSIYDNILANINYLDKYYNDLFMNIFNEEYMSPSKYLIIRNISKIFSSLEFAKNELDKWLENVIADNKQRVCMIHNNLSLDHFRKVDKEYLISWDKARIDTPVLDIVKFYKNSFFNIDFETILNTYFEKYKLSNNEKKLFFILISIPNKMILSQDDFNNCKEIRKSLDYIYKTEKLIGPYYSI